MPLDAVVRSGLGTVGERMAVDLVHECLFRGADPLAILAHR